MGSRHLASNTTVTASAFVGSNPTGELISSGLPVIQPEPATASVKFVYDCLKFLEIS